jgi:hypothetical protein
MVAGRVVAGILGLTADGAELEYASAGSVAVMLMVIPKVCERVSSKR